MVSIIFLGFKNVSIRENKVITAVWKNYGLVTKLCHNIENKLRVIYILLQTICNSFDVAGGFHQT